MDGWDGWVKKMWFLHTMNNSALKKKGNSALCDNTDEPGRHYAKWETGNRRTTMTWLHLYEGSKIVRLIEAENRTVLARSWGVGRMGSVNMYKMLTCYFLFVNSLTFFSGILTKNAFRNPIKFENGEVMSEWKHETTQAICSQLEDKVLPRMETREMGTPFCFLTHCN